MRACLQEAMPKDPTSIQSLGCAHKEGYHKVRHACIYPRLSPSFRALLRCLVCCVMGLRGSQPDFLETCLLPMIHQLWVVSKPILWHLKRE